MKYIAFLRGINVGGHHKLPMVGLRKELEYLGFKNIITLLNSGNVIFDSENQDLKKIEFIISNQLEKVFTFPIPTIIRTSKNITTLLKKEPLKSIEVIEQTRLYISFLKDKPVSQLKTPWISEDKSFTILEQNEYHILSILDLSIANTSKGMKKFEKLFGKNITTRTWNTIKRIGNKLTRCAL